MLLEEGADGKWRLVGINSRQIAKEDGSNISKAIYASQFNKFLDPILHETAAPTRKGK